MSIQLTMHILWPSISPFFHTLTQCVEVKAIHVRRRAEVQLSARITADGHCH